MPAVRLSSFLTRVAIDYRLTDSTVTLNEVKRFISDCIVFEYEWGVILAYQNHMHIHVLSDYRKKVFLRKYLRQVAHEMFKQYEVIKTCVYKEKPEQLAFDLRIGWKLTVIEDVNFHHLEMKKEDFKYD